MSRQDTSASSTPSEHWQHYRQQQHRSQETNRLPTESTPASLPPPLMIPNVNTVYGTHDHQYQYQHRQSFSLTATPWTLAHLPATPPSSQQDIMLMDQSLYDPIPTHHSRQLSFASTSDSFTGTITSSLEATEISPQQQQQDQKKHLRFHTVLQAMTAVTQKAENPLTYLNRNQSYGIQLVDKLGNDGLIQSQFTISFHDPAHQKVALSYWKFWIGQHKDPENARLLDLDPHQSIGILNVRYPSFDRIDFDWHGRHGAKLFVRFHCLSTDFSRIKGIKGIPLRICMSSQIPMADHNPLFQRNYAGSVHPKGKHETEMNYVEQSFCKVKIFRDKGAERKYKDDTKQLRKQFEKIQHDGDSIQHPMWLMYNRSVPYSIFSGISNIPSEVSPTMGPTELANTIKQQHQTKCAPKRQKVDLSHYQKHPNHYHPYTKRSTIDISTEALPPPPPSPLVPSSSSGTVTVPTQLYFSDHDSVLSSSSSSSSSPLPLMSDSDNGYPMVAPNRLVGGPAFVCFFGRTNQSK